MDSKPKKRRGGNPPKEYRFKPGQSGNPKGRPRSRHGRRRVDGGDWKLDFEIGDFNFDFGDWKLDELNFDVPF